jgi:hypothetical protein
MFLLLLLRCRERHFCSCCGGPVYYSHDLVIVSSRSNLYEY